MAWHSNLGMQRGADITLYSLARYIPWHTQSLANICICTILPASLICTLRQKSLVCCAVAKLLSISKFMIQDHRENFDMLQLRLFSWHQIWKCTYYRKNVVKGILTPQSAFSRVQWSSKCCESVSTYEVNRHTNQKKLDMYSLSSQNKAQHRFIFLLR